MAREYRTKAFNPAVSEKKANGDEIAKQLGEMIAQGATQGWTYQSYETVQITVNPGCLTFLSGPRTAHYGVLVFYRDQ